MEKTKNNFYKFLLLWVGEFISSIGGGMTSFGLGVYVFSKTGSATAMTMVTLVGFLPTILLGAPAGVLADRYDRRLLMMLGDGLSGLGVLFIFLCMLQGNAALWQICLGVGISAVFSSLMAPAYRATVTDLLTKEEYAKASGLVSLADSARYLISPVLAGILLAVSDMKLILGIDIATFFVTVAVTAVVKKGLVTKKQEEVSGFTQALKEGWQAITIKKGVLNLVLLASVMTCFMGFMQVLCEPMILSFCDSKTLGIAETICACGMLVSSLMLGMKGAKGSYVRMLWLALFGAGIAMAACGVAENIVLICIAGFLFFAMLPFANTALDYLTRTNIPVNLQGRAWGLIGVISQLGYIVAYVLAGVCADGIGKKMQIGVGRGAAVVIIIAGILLSVTALFIINNQKIRELERGDVSESENNFS
ncbi:MAG: MFS transporter [Roseburia sp.]|uniref:MFS transporter n=1 Tax=Roseburia hominis TaxID=301301 RepID=UPI001F427A4A|nr:MFS transporter [Roseburia hominis]